MSKIQEMLERMCPEGVELKKLEDVAKIMNGKDYKSFPKGDIPVYGTGGIMTYIDRFAYDKPSVLLPRKGSIDKIHYVSVPFWTVDTAYWTKINTETIEPKYLYYFLTTVDLAKMNTGTGSIPSLTQAVLNRIEIPVPPIAVQREIVKVLDSFSEHTAALVTELDAELAARKKQYEYYRDNLLKNDSIEWKTIDKLCTIGTGSRNTQDGLHEGSYPFYTRGIDVLRLESFDYDETAIITAGDGAGVGKVFHYVNGKYALHQRAYRIVPDESILNAKYLYFCFGAFFYDYIIKESFSSSVTSIRRPMLLSFSIPVPSLVEQERIVSILDRFNCYLSSLTCCLSDEIKARQQLYENYRDQLLTFKRAN